MVVVATIGTEADIPLSSDPEESPAAGDPGRFLLGTPSFLIRPSNGA